MVQSEPLLFVLNLSNSSYNDAKLSYSLLFFPYYERQTLNR